jgi:hypothetical protein
VPVVQRFAGVLFQMKAFDATLAAGDFKKAAEEGLALAGELYAQAREKAAGVYVIPPFKQPEAALDLLRS